MTFPEPILLAVYQRSDGVGHDAEALMVQFQGTLVDVVPVFAPSEALRDHYARAIIVWDGVYERGDMHDSIRRKAIDWVNLVINPRLPSHCPAVIF